MRVPLTIDWQKLSNPVLKHDYWSYKDPCMVWKDGLFYLFFSVFSPGNRSQVMHLISEDLVTFSDPVFLWGENDSGYCSPDIQFIDGMYYLTYQSWDPRPEQQKSHVKLWYSMSKDLVNWDVKHRQIAANLNVDQRAIDPGIAKHRDRWYCAWKQWQVPLIATADSLDSDNWELLGRFADAADTTENAQFFKVDGRWHVIYQSPNDGTKIYRMQGSGDSVDDWRHWEDEDVTLPRQEGFNDFSQGGALFIADWREHDGFFYTILHARYMESDPENPNMGHWLGIARSTDLRTWEFPGQRA